MSDLLYSGHDLVSPDNLDKRTVLFHLAKYFSFYDVFCISALLLYCTHKVYTYTHAFIHLALKWVVFCKKKSFNTHSFEKKTFNVLLFIYFGC